jgi:uncharacterized protein (TIGR02217 family)
MSNSVFPSSLNGLKWPVVKRPLFNTIVQSSVSLWELRASFSPYPQWEWTLGYNVLRQYGSNVEYTTLQNFFLARQGRFDSFLFVDVNDYTVTAEPFGTGDGATTTFQLIRHFLSSGFAEPVYNAYGANFAGNAQVYDNGVAKTYGVDYTISNGLVTFAVAPTIGHALTWTGTYRWRVRFSDDYVSFEEFASLMWQMQALKFVSVLGS